MSVKNYTDTLIENIIKDVPNLITLANSEFRRLIVHMADIGVEERMYWNHSVPFFNTVRLHELDTAYDSLSNISSLYKNGPRDTRREGNPSLYDLINPMIGTGVVTDTFLPHIEVFKDNALDINEAMSKHDGVLFGEDRIDAISNGGANLGNPYYQEEFHDVVRNLSIKINVCMDGLMRSFKYRIEHEFLVNEKTKSFGSTLKPYEAFRNFLFDLLEEPDYEPNDDWRVEVPEKYVGLYGTFRYLLEVCKVDDINSPGVISYIMMQKAMNENINLKSTVKENFSEFNSQMISKLTNDIIASCIMTSLAFIGRVSDYDTNKNLISKMMGHLSEPSFVKLNHGGKVYRIEGQDKVAEFSSIMEEIKKETYNYSIFDGNIAHMILDKRDILRSFKYLIKLFMNLHMLYLHKMVNSSTVISNLDSSGNDTFVPIDEYIKRGLSLVEDYDTKELLEKLGLSIDQPLTEAKAKYLNDPDYYYSIVENPMDTVQHNMHVLSVRYFKAAMELVDFSVFSRKFEKVRNSTPEHKRDNIEKYEIMNSSMPELISGIRDFYDDVIKGGYDYRGTRRQNADDDLLTKQYGTSSAGRYINTLSFALPFYLIKVVVEENRTCLVERRNMFLSTQYKRMVEHLNYVTESKTFEKMVRNSGKRGETTSYRLNGNTGYRDFVLMSSISNYAMPMFVEYPYMEGILRFISDISYEY